MESASDKQSKTAAYIGVSSEERFGYAQAVKVNETVYLSGQAAIGIDGELVAPAMVNSDGKPLNFSLMGEQMRASYASAERVLKQFNATLADVVQETLFVLDVPSALAIGGEIRKQAYGSARPQVASNVIGVSHLALAEQLIEISFVAVLNQRNATLV